MKRRALFVISTDPTQNHQPAEAFRIAAGILAWRKINVSVYLHQPAAMALADHLEHLPDRDLFRQCLPEIAAPNHPLLVPIGLSPPLQTATGIDNLKEITETELALFAADNTWVLHF